MKKRSAAYLFSLLLCFLLTSLAHAKERSPEQLCQQTCNNTNPYTTNCANYAEVIARAPLTDQNGHYTMGSILLWRSLSCQTVWAMALSDDYSCHIFAEIFDWGWHRLGGSTSLEGSAPLSLKGNLELAYTPQYVVSDPRIFASGNGKLCTGTGYSGDVYSQEKHDDSN